MPQKTSSSKQRERMHEEVRESLVERDESGRASDMNRAVVGVDRGAPSRREPQGRRGGGSRAEAAPRGRTRDQLYEEAKALGIPGRSKMDKDELQRAVDRKRGRIR